MYLYQTPGRCPPRIARRFVNIVTRGWVGAPNERTPFRFHGAFVGFVDRCLCRTRNPAAPNKHLPEFFSGRSWLKIGPGTIFFGVFEKCEKKFRRFVLIASGTEICWRVSLNSNFLWKHRVPIVTGLTIIIAFFPPVTRAVTNRDATRRPRFDPLTDRTLTCLLYTSPSPRD